MISKYVKLLFFYIIFAEASLLAMSADEIIKKIPAEDRRDLEKLLSNIEKGKITFSESIQNSEVLLGIFLGYGKHNALWYFHKEKLLRPLHWDNICTDYNYNPVRIKPVRFMVDYTHPETRSLK